MATEEKQQFRNNTDGWIGVVVIGPRGDDRGAAVEPNGTVWLSEQEQRLTANAPRDPANNPFVPQTFQRPLDEGGTEDYTLTPLTPIQEDRWVPANDRPIPTDAPVPVAEVATTVAPPVPARAARAVAAAQEAAAVKVDHAVGEETGAAKPPTGDAPEGEYAQAEEVGTPVAPQQQRPPQPPPYVPEA